MLGITPFAPLLWFSCFLDPVYSSLLVFFFHFGKTNPLVASYEKMEE
jgi:hypothetical protein